MILLALEIEYDGSDFAGWQLQSAGRTVQGELERAVSSLCGGACVRVQGAGRTDSGVHAGGQVAHCLVPDSFSVPAEKIPIALNSRLPDDVRALRVAIPGKPFHARYDACAREYSYKMSREVGVFARRFVSHIKFPFDGSRLNDCSRLFLGEHDFTAFSKFNPEQKNHASTIEAVEWTELRRDVYSLTIRANRFLYGQVRLMVGAMLDVARGKRSTDDVEQALATGKGGKISPAAPAQGLTLERVYYPKDKDPFVNLGQI